MRVLNGDGVIGRDDHDDEADIVERQLWRWGWRPRSIAFADEGFVTGGDGLGGYDCRMVGVGGVGLNGKRQEMERMVLS